MPNNHSNKNVLLFCPSFFGYDKSIKQEIEALGAKVSLFDERPFKSFIGKSILRLNLSWLIKKHIENYFKKIIYPQISDLDFLVFVNPESIPSSLIKEIKLLNKDIKVITYMWDSFLNKKNAKQLINVSDSFFTFDPKDAKQYNVSFLPLFYVSEYEEIRTKKGNKYDFSFVGTAHSDRYEILKKITSGNMNVFSFLYTPNKLVFLYKKYFCNELVGLSLKGVSSTSMSREEVIDVISDSRVVIDINHPSQVGLTIRTIETLAAGKKLITTNKEIKDYDFYNEDNILYYHSETTVNDVSKFIEQPFSDCCDKYKEFSLKNWVKKVLYE